jgi:hypothetical protein
MKWFEREGTYLCAPYRITLEAHGRSAWVYSKAHSGCLGRRMTLDQAKALCEKHKSCHTPEKST